MVSWRYTGRKGHNICKKCFVFLNSISQYSVDWRYTGRKANNICKIRFVFLMYHNLKSYQIPNHNFITKVTYNYPYFPTLVLYLVLYLGIVSGEQTRSLRSRSLISQANMDGHSALYLDSYLRKIKQKEKLVFDLPSKYTWIHIWLKLFEIQYLRKSCTYLPFHSVHHRICIDIDKKVAIIDIDKKKLQLSTSPLCAPQNSLPLLASILQLPLDESTRFHNICKWC